MSVADFVSYLHTLDIRLLAEGERLRVNAPKGILTEDLRAQIGERKAEILKFFSESNTSIQVKPPPISRAPRDSFVALSFAQERLWFLEQLEPGNPGYNICRAARLKGALNVAALELSIREILRRHESLRTKFIAIDGRPLQVVAPEGSLNIRTIDLRHSPEAERDREIERLITEEARRSFDLTQAPLLRVTLLRFEDVDHILIVATHHIVSDAWSMGILSRELWTLYEAHTQGRPSPLPELQVQYADYAAWQREWLQGEVLESQLSYWKRLANDPPVLNLLTDRPRPVRQSFRGASMPMALTESLTAAINELSRREGVTQYMTLLAAFNVLLFRYTGQENILVGSPIANRHHPQVESLIGYFVNTFVLRTHLSGNPNFKELLSRVRDVCLGAYAHQDLPFEKLVSELQPNRDLSRNPLFQVMFILQNAPRPVASASRIKVEPYNIDTGTSKFDLTLSLRERERKLIGFFEYSTDLFDHRTIERMAGHFQTMLEGIVAAPDQRIPDLPILTETEKHQLLIEWNNTKVEYPENKCIHELFEDLAERTPDAIAVMFEGKQLTYRELNTRANQLAHYLQRLGVGAETMVGICVERSLEMVVGLLGILKSGSAYVPLDPCYPKERLVFMLEDAQVAVVVTQEKVFESAQLSVVSHQPLLVCLDRDLNVIEEQCQDNPRNIASSTNLAYVIYTSGSTGKPKGVQINHRSVVNLLHSTQPLFQFSESDVWTGFHSYAFDFSVWEIWGCLLSGGRLVVVPVELTRSSEGFWNLLYEEKVTVLNQTPSAIGQLVEATLKNPTVPTDSNLRLIICGGEPLPVALASSLLKWGIPLWNFYGPTEVTVWATIHEIRPSDTTNSFVSIGRPFANVQIYILSSELQPVPVGVAGELHIGGDGLARGYLNKAELTAAKFIENPFKQGERLYRTGDLARYLSDGNIEFLGRIDNQVKVRGYRIEPGEIEAALNQHPAVKDNVIVARARESLTEKSLVGYIIPKQQPAPSVVELRGYLKEKLPEYMIPSAFVILDELPLTPNGKIHRQALPPADDARSQLEGMYVEPRTQVEELLAQIWREVLKLDTVGVHDNFFELGGHSLLAIQIISRVRELFNKEVLLSALFETPTIAGLAATVDKTISGRPNELPPIMRVSRVGPLRLSINQEHLWRLDQTIPGTHFFNIPYVYQLNGNLNVSALELSLQEIIRRHEALRTVFAKLHGCLVQLIKETLDFQLAIVNLCAESADKVSKQAAAVILEERERPFDLSSGPLFRAKLVRLNDTNSLLSITMHHIICDQWSMRVLLNELARLYESYSEARRSPLPEPPIQFADFAHWEVQATNSEFMQGQLAYWKRQLSEPLSALNFGMKKEPKKKIGFRISRRPIELEDNLFLRIKAFACNENLSLFMVLIAALSQVLFQYTGQRDIRIGTLVANRRRKETEFTVGYFVNTVVLRIRVDPRQTFDQLLKQVRDVTLGAYAHQELAFEYIGQELERERNVERTSLFQVLFMYQNMTAPPVYAPPGLTFAPVPTYQIGIDQNTAITSFDLIFDLREVSTKLTGVLTFKPEVFDDAVLIEMIKSFDETLRYMILQGE